MINRLYLSLLALLVTLPAIAQVDTTYVYNANKPYGTLDIRVRRSATNYFYLQEGKTFSHRAVNGVKTDTYLHMVSWDSQPYTQGHLREQVSAASNRFIMNYRLMFPDSYRTDVKYPIVIFFHGLMETGNCNTYKCIHADKNYDPNVNTPPAPTSPTSQLYNNDYQLLHGARRYMDARNRAGNKLVGDPALDPRGFPGFVLFPQSNNEWGQSEVENALKLLRLIVKKYNVDPNRIYINGLSRGGFAALEAIKRAPWMFAAGIMFSAVSDANILQQNMVPEIRHIPIWIFQGGKDELPTQRATEDRIRRFRNGGMSVRYTLYPTLGHGTWNTGMAEPDFFSWMLGFKLNKIHGFGGGESICATNAQDALTLYLPPGYKEYEWQRNNVTVKQGTENFIVAQQVGKYRARFRFSNNVWNEWSPEMQVDAVSPSAPTYRQLSTFHLPDLNNRNRTVVKADGEFAHYSWYRDGVILDFPGEADDTLSMPTIEAAQGGTGLYSLRVANLDGCYSIPSETRRIFFNGESPVTLGTPGNVTAGASSPSVVRISWQDNSDGESGFEVWRRVNSADFSPWELAVVTAPNATSFSDQRLKPSTKYDYKVRAVSETARSDYFPGEGTAATVETPEDTTPPTRPTNVTAELAAINALLVQWEPSTDNTYVQEYLVYVNGIPMPTGSADTLFWVRGLNVNTYYTIQVAAVDADGNIGPKSAPITVNSEMTGLFYTHATGAWLRLDSINWDAYEYSGFVDDFDLSPKTQEDFFNFRFDGYIYVQNSGAYQFRVTSSDGSTVMLNGELIIDNDEIHESVTVSSETINLSSGPQRITVDYFDYMGEEVLMVEYMGPDTNGEWVVIDAEKLKSTGEPGAGDLKLTVYPNPGSNGITQLLFEGGTGDPMIIRIMDAMGKQVREYFLTEDGVNHMTITDLDVESGVYIVVVNQYGNVVSERFVVIR